ncbi:hypothetical protein NT6N_03730 [Oceaniferula spumae]|uniref:DUF4340 domain-containing protein n=1 Tax=Oceaniferula spumae TaxID=2979115 RepID=A0AAT9FH98_9BACT
MKSRTVIILWAIALVLGIAAYVVKFHGEEDHSTRTKLAPGDRLYENLPVRQVAKVTISQGNSSTHLVKGKDNEWGVAERDDYQVNYELLRNLLGALNDLEVTQGYPASSEHFGRFGLADETSKEDSELGYFGAVRVTMSAEDGTKLAEVLLGKYSGTSRVGGRFVRIDGDDSGVYAVGQTFPGVTAEPKDWLNKDFIKFDQIQSITLTAPDDPSFTGWKLVRPTTQGQFKVADLSDQELMKLTSTNTLRDLFNYAAFQDVISGKKAAELANPDVKLKRKAVISTFDGLTYTLVFWPQKDEPKDKDADPRLPAVQPKYLLTIAVDAEFPKTRNKSADEKPEDAQALDARFKQQQILAREKLALAERLQGRIFQISQSVISPLQKKRADFVTAKNRPSASTPPVQVPAQPAPTHPLQPLPPQR